MKFYWRFFQYINVSTRNIDHPANNDKKQDQAVPVFFVL